MQNGHTNININTTISAATELGVSQGIGARRAVVSSLENIDKPLDLTPPPLYIR